MLFVQSVNLWHQFIGERRGWYYQRPEQVRD